MADTHVRISSTVLGSSASSVTLSSIPTTYTDLILDMFGTSTGGEGGCLIRVGNGSVDTGANYCRAYMYGSGSGNGYDRLNNTDYAMGGRYNTSGANGQVHFMSYTSTSMYKTILNTAGHATLNQVSVSTWLSTSVINTILIRPETADSFATGWTFNLYGITRH